MLEVINSLWKSLLRNEYSLYFLYYALIFYLLLNTGLISDGFVHMLIARNESFSELLIPKGNYINMPVLRYSHHISYSLFSLDSQIVVNLFKISYIITSFYFISKFFSIYLDRQGAFLISFLFIFFPSHDGSTYFYLGQYLTLTFSFYLFSFYLAYSNRLVLAALFAFVASFISYGSPAIASALFLLFMLNNNLKKGLFIFIPNIIFAIYFIVVSRILAISKPRISEGIEPYTIIKLFLLQIISFIDSMFGPSMWLKIYYSFYQLSITSWIIGVSLTIVFYKKYKGSNNKYNVKLILCFTTLMFCSFVMFAMTGLYPQLTFNLGNRTTIFGSLLISYIIVLMPLSKKWKTLVFAIMIFTILGVSDHWKNWNIHQQHVIDNIKNNQALRDYKDDKHTFVSGNQYSKYGPISHIEFFSENWVPNAVFHLVLNEKICAVTINKRHVYEDGYLIDTKNNTKAEVNDYINVYDSVNDRLFTLNVEEINSYIDSLPPENRHWIMLSDNRLVSFVKNIVIKLMPRLEYAL